MKNLKIKVLRRVYSNAHFVIKNPDHYNRWLLKLWLRKLEQ